MDLPPIAVEIPKAVTFSPDIDPVRAGMIARTPRGRVATPQAWTHLGLAPPPSAGQPGLFD